MITNNNVDNYGAPWKREELILAFELYCRIPFKKTKANNTEIINLAGILHRTPASVARKLGNFGAFDPHLRQQNISGLPHYSRLDREIWNEFNNDWNNLVFEAYRIRKKTKNDTDETINIIFPDGPTEQLKTVKHRVHQSFFRQTIMTNYEWRCCITGLSIPECLIASHIIPWSKEEKYRTDPTNGLCLSSTFDKLFDNGLLTISDDFSIMISDSLLRSEDRATKDAICVYNGKPMMMPHRFVPSSNHLKWHRDNVFVA
ncbi:MAG TPA: HNH endonuclease [bacterium]|nr:HNH endonuclease [bacterium]